MTEFTASSVPGPTLPDPWERTGPIPLDGVLERNRFSPLLVAVLAVFVGMVGYMVIGGILTVVLLLVSGAPLDALAQDSLGAMAEHTAVLLGGNALGLFLGLGVIGIVLARLTSSRPWAFLRLRTPDLVALGLSVFGLFALMPIVQWAGSLNQALPLPEFLREMEDVQLELIEQLFREDLNVLFSLVMVAVTPALFEEIFFRGFVQRHFERGLGAAWGIAVTGFIFGLFHLRLTQLLPLAILGIYLAYLAWRTGSLWIPIVVHFANNAFAVLTAEYVQSHPELGVSDLEQIAIPWYLVLLGFVIFSATVYALQRWAHQRLTQQPVASPG